MSDSFLTSRSNFSRKKITSQPKFSWDGSNRACHRWKRASGPGYPMAGVIHVLFASCDSTCAKAVKRLRCATNGGVRCDIPVLAEPGRRHCLLRSSPSTAVQIDQGPKFCWTSRLPSQNSWTLAGTRAHKRRSILGHTEDVDEHERVTKTGACAQKQTHVHTQTHAQKYIHANTHTYTHTQR